jgi:hypothetical protein
MTSCLTDGDPASVARQVAVTLDESNSVCRTEARTAPMIPPLRSREKVSHLSGFMEQEPILSKCDRNTGLRAHVSLSVVS